MDCEATPMRPEAKTGIRIKQSLDRCLELYHRSPVGYLVLSDDSRVMHANMTMGAMLSANLSDLLFKPISIFIHPIDKPRFASHYPRLFRNPDGKHLEIRFLRKDGSVFIGRLTGSHIRSDMSDKAKDQQQRPQLLISVNDVTVSRSAERMLYKAKRQWEQTFDAVPDLIAIIDEKFVIRRINKAFAQRLALSPKSCIGQKCYRLVFAQQACPEDCPHLQSLQTGKPVKAERFVKRFNRHFSISATPFSPGGRGIKWGVVVYHDISERKLAEKELLKSRTLQSIGNLAGGIAHDYNNLLTGLVGYIELAKVNLADEDIVATYLDKTEVTIEHLKTLTSRLLTFSSGGSPRRHPIDPRHLLKETVTCILAGSQVRPDYSIPDNLHFAHVDELQIKIAFRSIIDNAIEAMPQAGELHIKLNNVDIPEGKRYLLDPGKYIKIQFQDTGCGIPSRDLDKIFDPYYSTKARGPEKGMGLGLAISYSIIKKHDGHIDVKSEEEKGTVVTVYLPASVKSIKNALGDTESSRLPAPDCPKFLVMDDETGLWEMLEQLFAAEGCKVDFAANGEKALHRYQKALSQGCPYTGVFLDLNVDGEASGKQVLTDILSLDPAAKAVAFSGDTSDSAITNPQAYGFTEALEKPFKQRTLRATIFRIINHASPASKSQTEITT